MCPVESVKVYYVMQSVVVFSGNIQTNISRCHMCPSELLSLCFMRTNFCVLAFLTCLGNEKMRRCLCLPSHPARLWLFTLFEYKQE